MVLGIYGSGGCGRETKDVAEMLGRWQEIVFIDDTVEAGMFKGTRRMPFDLFCQEFDSGSAEVIIALGEPKHRIDLYNKVKQRNYPFANVVHPTAWISPSARLGKGLIIKSGAFISCDAIIEDNARIDTCATVGHDCIVRESSQLSSNVVMGGGSEIGAGAYIGLSVLVRDTVKIGAGSVIGMGSAVQRDIPENVIALGNPARVAKRREDGHRVFG